MEMRTDSVNRSLRFFGLIVLLNFCCLSTGLRDAEAFAASDATHGENKFSCMIAKSAYGSPSFDEPIRRLHQFRDQVLMGSALSRWVAKAYYRLSGSLAPHLDGHGLSGWSLKWAIRAFLYLVKYLEAIGLGTGAVLVAFVLGREATRAFKTSPFFPRRSKPGS